MPPLPDVWRWFNDNEGVLSGIAAILAISGVAVSAVVGGARRLFPRDAK